MKITLKVNGRYLTFSEQRLTAILEDYLIIKTISRYKNYAKVYEDHTSKFDIILTLLVNNKEKRYHIQELKAILEEYIYNETAAISKAIEKPTVGKWFNVNPLIIDQSLFEKKRSDWNQEVVRQKIRDAFSEMEENIKRYGKPFQTLIPDFTWSSSLNNTVDDPSNYIEYRDLWKTAAAIGGPGCSLADDVFQRLEWAQRIANGESWESICNKPDTIGVCRYVKRGAYYIHIGAYSNKPCTYLGYESYATDWISCTGVPLIVRERTVNFNW